MRGVGHARAWDRTMHACKCASDARQTRSLQLNNNLHL
jgi:hypothetical protein